MLLLIAANVKAQYVSGDIVYKFGTVYEINEKTKTSILTTSFDSFEIINRSSPNQIIFRDTKSDTYDKFNVTSKVFDDTSHGIKCTLKSDISGATGFLTFLADKNNKVVLLFQTTINNKTSTLNIKTKEFIEY